jgi:hypothetical protein
MIDFSAGTSEGAKHRNRRRYDGVAVKQRRPYKTEEENDHRAPSQRALRQSHQREHPALALVVRSHDEKDVFKRHDQEQRPERQGHHAEDGGPAHRVLGRLGHGRLESVERACADITEYNADGADRESPEAGPALDTVYMHGRFLRQHGGAWGRVRLADLRRRKRVFFW